MQKPHLSAVTSKGVEFLIKVKFTHLHENDILMSEDNYTIKVIKSEDVVYELKFNDPLTFAKTAYEIGNRHQPICIEAYKITVLDDLSLSDIIKTSQSDETIEITKTQKYFKPNGKAHHSH
ncbi:MAG TPA: urease accessory protein UreE [Epsilonproteobacteria bacterium]|nr:urease accessory protein UreE [Campylobacterota bacterium]